MKRCTSQRTWHFYIRIFKSGNGNYFQQIINSSGTTSFKIITLNRVQEFVEKCESTDGNDKLIWKSESSSSGKWVIKDETVITKDTKQSDIDTEYLKEHEEITDFEIIDKELYGKIIEEY